MIKLSQKCVTGSWFHVDAMYLSSCIFCTPDNHYSSTGRWSFFSMTMCQFIIPNSKNGTHFWLTLIILVDNHQTDLYNINSCFDFQWTIPVWIFIPVFIFNIPLLFWILMSSKLAQPIFKWKYFLNAIQLFPECKHVWLSCFTYNHHHWQRQ